MFGLHGFAILMVVASVALVFAAAAWLFVRLLKREPRPLIPVAAALGGWTALYLGTLAAVSLASEPRVLGINEDKKFCGFYLDCHTGVAVTNVDTASRIGGVTAAGVFHVVTLRIGSDAVRAELELVEPRMRVHDAAGRAWDRSPAGEAALAQARGSQPTLTEPLAPGASYTTTVVFDLPRDAAQPQLDVTVGFWAERLIERFLIGDEDSWLHKPTTIRLPA